MIQAKHFIFVGLALLVTACSTVKLSYNNAEWLLMRALNAYFDLDDTQEAKSRIQVRELLTWHRRTQLITYAQLLTDAAQLVQHPVSDADVLDLIQRVNTHFSALGQRVGPALAELLLTLDSAQIAHCERKQAESAQALRDDLLEFDDNTRLAKPRLAWYKKHATFWFGSIAPEQLTIISAITATRPVGEVWWISERERRQSEFIQLLQRLHSERPSTDEAAQWIQMYIAQLITPPDPERREGLRAFRHSNSELIAQLINAATIAQRQNLTKKLRGYAEDLRTLAQVEPSATPRK